MNRAAKGTTLVELIVAIFVGLVLIGITCVIGHRVWKSAMSLNEKSHTSLGAPTTQPK